MKAKKWILTCIFLSSTCLAQTVVETREVLDDGTILVKLKTEDGRYTWRTFLWEDIEIDSSFSEWEDSPEETFGNDELDATIWMPDEFSGCLPQDVCYNSIENKYYFYGGRSLVVVDGATNTLIKRITVSNTGRFDDVWAGYKMFPIDNRLAFNPIDNKLYCATDEVKLVVIDCSTDEIIHEFPLFSYSITIWWLGVYYNQESNKVYFAGSPYSSYPNSVIKVFDGSTDNLICSQQFVNTAFGSFTGNPSGSKLYLSTFLDGNEPYLRVLDGTSLSLIEEIPMESFIGDMVYNQNSDKLYALTPDNAKIIVVDGLTDELEKTVDINDTYLRRISSDYINNKIYCTGTQNEVHIINGEQDEYITSVPVSGACSLVFNPYESATFCGGNGIYKIDGENDQVINSTTIYGTWAFGLAYNSQTHNVTSCDKCAGLICIVDSGCNLLTSHQIGGAIVFGCYNSQNNKIYYSGYSSPLVSWERSFISIIDGRTNQVIKKIDTSSNLLYSVYNESVNKVYVLRESEREILVIDGETDTIIDTVSILHDNYPFCLFPGPNNKIYCGGCCWINVIDCETDEIITSLWTGGCVRDFTYNSEYNKLYAAQYGVENNEILVIDPDNDTVLEEICIGESNPTNFSMAYNSTNNKVYCADCDYYGTVTVIDCYDDEILTVIDITYPTNIVYNELNNKLYLTSNNGISIIDGDTDEIVKEFESSYVGSSGYNPNNNCFYFQQLKSPNTLEMKVKVIDCVTDEICSEVLLEQKNRRELLNFHTLFTGLDMVYDSQDNKMFCGNQGFSNVSAIQCSYPDYDNKALTAGWNWVSFPVLPNPDGTNALEVLEPILDPEVLDQVVNEDGIAIQYNEEGYWENNLPDGNFRSIDGYKIKMHEDAELGIVGIREDPSTVIHLYAEDKAPEFQTGRENWIGYFLPYSQAPQTAFEQIWDKLIFIKADTWAMLKKADGSWWGSMPPGGQTVDYGKLYIVGVSEDCSFTWGTGDAKPPYVKSETEIFTYQEEADYMPIFVDSTEALNGIDEIGVFLEDECIGASVVEGFPVFIPAYIEEDSTGSKDYNELTFQVASYDKSGKASISVFVYDETQAAFVEEPVILDATSYAVVRLGTGEGIEFPQEFTLYQNYPNPVINSTTISFIPSPGVEKSEIEIYNIKGQLIKQYNISPTKSGLNKLVWDGKDAYGTQVGNGIYFYKVTSGNRSAVKKMVIMR